MSDINRILIFVVLIGFLFAIYKYQNTIYQQIDLLIQNKPITPPPMMIEQSKIVTKPNPIKNVTVDNISQISYSSLALPDSNALSLTDGNTFTNDNVSCDSKKTYGSLFDD